MAKREITGRIGDGLDEKRREYEGTPKHESGIPFEEAFCLATIRYQPDEYDGPKRNCVRHAPGDDDFCRYHSYNRHLDKLGNMKHGLTALDEHFEETLSEQEQKARQEIIDEWERHYDLSSPSAEESVRALATQILRDYKMNEFIAEEGMTKVKTVFGPNGEETTEEVEHYMLSEERATRRLIQDLKDDLATTRKHEDQMDAAEKSSEAMLEALGGEMNDAIGDEDEHDYDPSEFDDE